MTIYVDRLTLSALIAILFLGLKGNRVLYFTEATSLAVWLHSVLEKVGLLQLDVAKNPHYYMGIREEDGPHWSRWNIGYVADVDDIFRRTMKKDPLISKFVSRIGKSEHVERFFYNLLYSETVPILKQIVFSRWCAQEEGVLEDSLYLVGRDDHTGFMIEHAQAHGMRCHPYREMGRWKDWPVFKHILLVRQVLVLVFQQMRALRNSPDCETFDGDAKGTIVQHYVWSKVLVDGSEKSELHWLDEDQSLSDRVVLAEFNGDCAAPGAIETLKKRGVRFIGSNPEAEDWVSTKLFPQTVLPLCGGLLKDVISVLFTGKSSDCRTIKRLSRVLESYGYWLDFYTNINAKVVTSCWLHDIGKILAIEKLGIVTVLTQDSISGYDFYPPVHYSGHFLLAYSDRYVDAYKNADMASNYLLTGYNHPLKKAVEKGREQIQAEREKLVSNGAEFVVCFFDENFQDRWFYNDPFETLDVYAELFRRVVEDPTFGLICKPKQTNSIVRRLKPVGDLLQAAMDTGRCIVHQSTSSCRAIYPGVTASSADVCIGKELGGTASLEAALVGTRSVMLDGCIRKPVHGGVSLDGQVCFQTQEALFDALDQYRENPEEHNEFGDWSPWLNALVKHVDDDGPLRMATVCGWLVSGFDKGMTREQVLSNVMDNYAEKWGASSVIRCDDPETRPWERETVA